MNDLIDILVYHQKLYPLMQPQDIIKLIYQNEFGGGHLITDCEKSLFWIKKEFMESNHQQEALITPIGNNIVRVSIHQYQGSMEKLNEVFIESSKMVSGTKENLLRKFEIVRNWINNGNIFSFKPEEFNEYLVAYIESGCPLVSHSDIYRNEYNPSYRVVLKSLL